MKSKYLIRYVVVRYTPKHHIPEIMDKHATPRKQARDIMQALASKDFANYAMYGLRRIKIRVPSNTCVAAIDLTQYPLDAWAWNDIKDR